MSLTGRIEAAWHHRGTLSTVLLPLSGLYCGVVRHRRHAFLRSPPAPLPAPVIVVGNVTVGGTGKTPMVIWLCEWLRGQGWRPGVVSRGYGGRERERPRKVTLRSRVEEVGDEPVLIALRTSAPVCVSTDRVAAARVLLDEDTCDILIADDGLQHYRLPRDLEIAMLDGQKRLGNGLCLPAGPLREPAERLQEVDFVVITQGDPSAGEYQMILNAGEAWSLGSPGLTRPLDAFANAPLHAVAGIGNTERFFVSLEGAGLRVVRHPFPDHHRFRRADLAFGADTPVLMTEKDAVKCREFAPDNAWAVPVTAAPSMAFVAALAERTRKLRNGQKTA